MFWNRNRRPNPAGLNRRETLGILLSVFGAAVFIFGWCTLMFESGHARTHMIDESLYSVPIEPEKILSREHASIYSIWLVAGTALLLLGLLVVRRQFSILVLLGVAFISGAAGAIPFLFLKH